MLHAFVHIDHYGVAPLDGRTRDILRESLVKERDHLASYGHPEEFGTAIAQCEAYVGMLDAQDRADFNYRAFGVR